jgi:hypothetical protein
MSTISENDVQWSNLSLVDDVGRVFHWNGGIFRGIYPQAAERVRALFASGLLDELTSRGFFPRTQITSHTFDGFAFVVEHEAVPIVTYPHEWSFDMLRDAARTVLEIGEIAARFDWLLKDCHPYNVLFHGTRPLYVDLGSFVPATAGYAWSRGDAFLSLYWWPLSIWSSGDYFLAQRIISSAHESMPAMSWSYLIVRRLGRWFGPCIATLCQYAVRGIAYLCRKGGLLDRLAAPLLSRLPADFLANNPEMLRRKIVRLPSPALASFWRDYHSEFMRNGVPTSTPRFDRIVDIVQSLAPESVVDLAGNQGVVSMLLAARTPVRRIICTDYDASAINRLYGYCRAQSVVPPGTMIQPAVINFMIPETNFYTIPPADRFRADVVMALAVTHHLTISQNFSLRLVMRKIASYTCRFALVEFMPLGLWDGRHQTPPLPSWYGPAWFRQAFEEFFEVLSVEEVETNRVLYLGRLKGS